jgi:hypothetical protein
MGQQAYRLPFYMETWSISPLWIGVTMLLCWNSIKARLMLTLETYQQSFGAQSCCMTVISSLLTGNKPFLGRIICNQ